MNLEKLKGHIPDNVISQIPDVMKTFGIDTPVELAHFLSQCGHESAGFKVVNVNLNYSAKGLVGIFKKYFYTPVNFVVGLLVPPVNLGCMRQTQGIM